MFTEEINPMGRQFLRCNNMDVIFNIHNIKWKKMLFLFTPWRKQWYFLEVDLPWQVAEQWSVKISTAVKSKWRIETVISLGCQPVTWAVGERILEACS